MRSRLTKGLAALTLTAVLVGGGTAVANAASGDSSSSGKSSRRPALTTSATDVLGDARRRQLLERLGAEEERGLPVGSPGSPRQGIGFRALFEARAAGTLA